jgi:hypothetical protein
MGLTLFFNSKLWFSIPLATMLFVLGTGLSQAGGYPKWDLRNNVPESGEYISYKIAYRGFFTGYSWKNLADMVLHNKAESHEFNQHEVCQSVMRLSTENFSFAELFHPVRYEWIANNNIDLSYTRLVEYIDLGKSDNYHVVWMDWPHEMIKVYRKRERKPDESDKELSFLGEHWAQSNKFKWEDDGAEALPSFLSHYPRVDNGRRSFLIHDKTVREVGDKTALEPLAVLEVMRRHDFKKQPSFDINITVDEDVKMHTVRYQDDEVLVIGGINLPAIRLRVANSEKNQADKEGWMDIWISQDERRLPLRYQVDAPVGKMRVQITQESLVHNLNYDGPRNCYVGVEQKNSPDPKGTFQPPESGFNSVE